MDGMFTDTHLSACFCFICVVFSFFLLIAIAVGISITHFHAITMLYYYIRYLGLLNMVSVMDWLHNI